MVPRKASQKILHEIKSGQTFQKSYFKGIRYWKKLTQQAGGIIYYAEKQTNAEVMG